MQINLRRGLFRIWVAISALWLIMVGATFYKQIVSPNIPQQVYVLPSATSDFYKLDNVFEQFDPGFKAAHGLEIQFPNNVSLFPVNGIPKSAIEPRVQSFLKEYCNSREPEIAEARWKSLETASAIGLLPPLALLVLGLVVLWIVGGFKTA